MTWGVLLIRGPILSWMIVVKYMYTARNKFLAFGGLNSKIDGSMARKPIVLLLYYCFVTYTTLTLCNELERLGVAACAIQETKLRDVNIYWDQSK